MSLVLAPCLIERPPAAQQSETAHSGKKVLLNSSYRNLCAGLELGRQVADAIIALRERDGWDDFVTHPIAGGLGVWEPTAPMFAQALLPQWATLEPFAMTSPDQFRPDGPPELTSQAWAEAYNEVKSLGRFDSLARTQEQTQIARFWAARVRPAARPQ
jgi:hypothetical protein